MVQHIRVKGAYASNSETVFDCFRQHSARPYLGKQFGPCGFDNNMLGPFPHKLTAKSIIIFA